VTDVALAAVAVGAALAAVVVARGALAASAASRRLRAQPLDDAGESTPVAGRLGAALRAWLARAGFRGPRAVPAFTLAAVAALAAGAGVAAALRAGDAFGATTAGLARLPGGVGQPLLPLLALAPVVAATALAALPWLVVSAHRRRLVEAVEQDLPITLELLATLAEAGLGFDAALARVVDAQPAERPLTRELRVLQLELRTARPRAECFQRLRDRLAVASVTVLVAALVTAEQLGASIAEVLRTQSEDLRQYRRERALAAAQALPVRLVFPLLIGFLPAVFVVVLGPAVYSFLQLAESVVRSGR
jgi:tight adherence protein C